MALMAKWIWRFLSERNRLWARVIRECQGDIWWDEEGFKIKGNKTTKAGWWKSVLEMSWGEGGKWLRQNLQLQIGEGESILFWHHCWSGDRPLAVLFPRLFHLSDNQGGTLNSMGLWDEGSWEWKLTWNREPRERDREQINTLDSLIRKFQIVAGKRDTWRWKADPSGFFSVKTAYKALSSQFLVPVHHQGEKVWSRIWKAKAPFKAITTAWKVLKGRLPTCDELQKRQVNISHLDAMCALCKSKPESIIHVLFGCHNTNEVWKGILCWINKHTALHQTANEHLTAFINLGNKEDITFLEGIWICTIWCIWKGRNECKFNQGIWRTEKMLTEIKTRFWGWALTFNLKTEPKEFRRWASGVKLCG